MNWESIVGIFLIGLGTFLTYLGTYKSSKNSQEELTKVINEKNSAIENINANNSNINSINTKLITINANMLEKISKYQEDIEKKELKIEALQEKVSLAERGIESIIEKDGTYRIRQGNTINFNPDTEEHSYFIRMVDLEKKKDWLLLIKLCEESIKKYSKWYTPYIFKANVLLFLDLKKNKGKALDLLDYVTENTFGDIGYAVPLLDTFLKLNEKERVNKIINKISIADIQTIEDTNIKNDLLKLKQGSK